MKSGKSADDFLEQPLFRVGRILGTIEDERVKT